MQIKYSDGFKKELSELKKINQIGKKLTDCGCYIMRKGMLYGCETKEPTDFTATGMAICFIDPKSLEWLMPLMQHNLYIDGNELYQIQSKGKFLEYVERDDCFELKYSVEEVVSDQFDIEQFSKYAQKKGFTDFDVVVAYQRGWDTNMAIYNLYLKFIDKLGEHVEQVTKRVKLRYVPDSHWIINKANEVASYLQRCSYFAGGDIGEEDSVAIMNSGIPVDITIPVCDKESHMKKYDMRPMKSLFRGIASTSKLSIRLFTDYNYDSFGVFECVNGNSVICTVYRMVIFYK